MTDIEKRMSDLRDAVARRNHEKKLAAAKDWLGRRWVLHPNHPGHYQCPDQMKEASRQ